MEFGVGSVLQIVFSEDLTIGSDNFGGQIAAWIFQILESRHFAEAAR